MYSRASRGLHSSWQKNANMFLKINAEEEKDINLKPFIIKPSSSTTLTFYPFHSVDVIANIHFWSYSEKLPIQRLTRRFIYC